MNDGDKPKKVSHEYEAYMDCSCIDNIVDWSKRPFASCFQNEWSCSITTEKASILVSTSPDAASLAGLKFFLDRLIRVVYAFLNKQGSPMCCTKIRPGHLENEAVVYALAY